MLVLEGNPLCNVVVSNALVLVLEVKLVSIDFSSKCNVVVSNVFLLAL